LAARGYASGFEGLIGFIMALVPSNEVIEKALRRTVPMFPELAVRELVANALIHQDFFVTGAGPMVEIFDDRMEITNPGEPLIDTQRFIDTPPKSRNEALASLMRRFRICEERGSGIDKVVFEVEYYQLPAPIFEVPEGFTRAVLFAHRPLNEMDKADRVRACYLHACLKWVMRDYLTNASLRERFGVEEKNKAAVSRYIRDAVEEGAIKPFDEGASRKLRKYVPYWAKG
jgi:predicted HTH transcriptional regulator